ncbi:MAG: hypothetical protein EBW87_02540, partial [Burkholderiaceae bacterium]|nr:hypothetical protein [Burkholderiaceae bacterium]
MDVELWPHQKYAIDASIQKVESGLRSFCVTSPTGGGKCLGRDTPVLMYDGSVRPVQNISDGDILMGPDSSPRRVVGTTRGTGPLFTVTPTKGMPYAVSFQAQEVPLDPYYLGIWLGDGTATSTQVTKPDKEIEHAVHAVANEHDCNVTTFFNSSMVPHHSIVRKNGTAQTNPVLE